jgi:hypothetical protein
MAASRYGLDFSRTSSKCCSVSEAPELPTPLETLHHEGSEHAAKLKAVLSRSFFVFLSSNAATLNSREALLPC